MRRSIFAAAASSAAALLALVGCGSDEATPAAPQNEGEIGQPPQPGPENAGDGAGVVFAVDKLFLGDTDRSGKASGTAWRRYGYNIDGKVSSATSTDLCKPSGAATPEDVYPDGLDGIDNSFGKNLLSLITSVVPGAASEANDAIAQGQFTIMLSLEGLGGGPSYYPITTKLYGGARLDAPPAWDGNDRWPVLPELLDDPQDIDSAKVIFRQSYVVDNTWVSGTKGTVQLNLSIAGNNISLTIGSALISMELDPDREGAVNGTIAGVIETELLIQELQKVIGAIQPSFCTGTTFETVRDQIRSASDILKNGTQDPAKECDAISVGLGFTAKRVQLGDIAAPAAPGENPCAAPAGGG